MKKILVTGGAGFIGSFLTELLLKDGFSVTVADNFSTGALTNLAAVQSHPALRIEELDVVQNAVALENLIRESDAVVHLAAALGVEMVVNEPAFTLRTNVHGSENVLEPAAKYGKRLILASTSEVYGKSPEELFTESDDLHLGNPSCSRWSYACSKLLDEFMVMAYCQSPKIRLKGTVVRFFNTVGPRQTGRYGMVVPRFVRAALNGDPLNVYGDGQQSRCFCHVADVVRAVRGLLDTPESYGKIYNIGSQDLITIEALAERVIARLNSSSKIARIPYDQAYGRGFEDMRRRRPNTAAVQKLLNWQPEKNLDSIIDDTAEYFRTHDSAC